MIFLGILLLLCSFHGYIGWLDDAAYFAAIDDCYDTYNWYDWPEPLKNRHLAVLQDTYQSKREFVRCLPFDIFPFSFTCIDSLFL